MPWPDVLASSAERKSCTRGLCSLLQTDMSGTRTGYAGWDPKYRVRVRIICVRAYHALFMRNMVPPPLPHPVPPAPKPHHRPYYSGRGVIAADAPPPQPPSPPSSTPLDPSHLTTFQLVMPPEGDNLEGFVPDLIIFNAGGFPANRYVEGMTSSCSVRRLEIRSHQITSEFVAAGTAAVESARAGGNPIGGGRSGGGGVCISRAARLRRGHVTAYVQN